MNQSLHIQISLSVLGGLVPGTLAKYENPRMC